MIKGLYAAASAMLAGVERQQSLAHNVANLETPGFKQVLSTLEDFMQAPVTGTSPSGLFSSTQLLGRIGLGVAAAPDTIDLSQGGLRTTDNPLDLAIQGNGFFVLRTSQGERYTRDGRFIRDAAGQMVSVDGYPLLNTNRQPIQVPDGSFSVSPDGSLSVDGQALGQLALVNFADPAAALVREGNNTYQASAAPTQDKLGLVQQGALEMSNANPAQLMAQMVEVTRSYQAAQQMVQNQDELLGKSISSLGQLG
ncbi:MAG: flagellar basal-body rod protein FlgF [Anaerolineaceae bacterium]|nr:flagellar basal-body rod protein FlgF [Anaerolineaceae bacterium]